MYVSYYGSVVVSLVLCTINIVLKVLLLCRRVEIATVR